MAQDKGFPPLSRTVEVQIDVVDRANNPPVWDHTVYGPIYIRENLPVGAKVVSVKARCVANCSARAPHAALHRAPAAARRRFCPHRIPPLLCGTRAIVRFVLLRKSWLDILYSMMTKPARAVRTRPPRASSTIVIICLTLMVILVRVLLRPWIAIALSRTRGLLEKHERAFSGTLLMWNGVTRRSLKNIYLNFYV